MCGYLTCYAIVRTAPKFIKGFLHLAKGTKNHLCIKVRNYLVRTKIFSNMGTI